MTTDYRFNERLSFSWGHIIALLALIAIAYCTFVGIVYILKGQFILSGIITAAIILLTGALFIVPQKLKATTHRFERRILWERILIFASPILFILLMIPCAHSWTVHQRQQKILDGFGEVIHSASQMFTDYETYSTIRKSEYAHLLSESSTPPIDSLTVINKQNTLDLILLSQNYKTLKTNALQWIEKAENKKVTTWNVFLLGNITEIDEAIHNWHNDLQEFSETKLSDEPEPKLFDSSHKGIHKIEDEVTELTANYSNILGFSPITLLWILLGYCCLLLPYLLQSRHSKTIGTQWSLFGFRKGRTKTAIEPSKSSPTDSPDTPEQEEHISPAEEEEYKSFKI